jgi:predicted polyphosphate/ATP-dependent NAD kinase
MELMKRIAFVINPIAGMGGRVGLKGTDGVIDEALKRGAKPRSFERAIEAMERLQEAFNRHRVKEEVLWLTASGKMGEEIFDKIDHDLWKVQVIHECKGKSTSEDTREFVRKAIEKDIDLVLFCGGDGTARDVLSKVKKVPMFGIPAGVKMHSGVFGVDPQIAGELLEFFIRGEMTTGEGEVMDLDEDRYRKGEWNIKLFGLANTLFEPAFVQTGKFVVQEEGIEGFIEEITEDMVERMKDENDTLFILGPGGTLENIGSSTGIDKTHLGIDAVKEGEQLGKDLNETSLIRLIEDHDGPVKLILSPIGGQGFFIGRGNLQLSPDVIRRIGSGNIIVVSVPQKLDRTDSLRVDTGDHDLDMEFKNMGSIKVLTGYRTYRMKKIR